MSSKQQSASIGNGSHVRLHYSIALEDGTIADSTREDNEPLDFTLGDGTMVEGLELALIGLKAGERQSLRIGPENAYGFRDEANVHIMPRSDFSQDMNLERGLIIGFTAPSGLEIPGTILDVGEDEVKVDFNHPLAGHEITFDVEILSVESGAANDEE
jgi:FKBP-type peptidyl-prolyl cis-trans isomerase SlpA